MNKLIIEGSNYFGHFNHVREACRAVILNDDNILLCYETNNDIWMIPGGGKEIDETDDECVIREVGEETGNIFKPSMCVLEIDEYYGDVKYVSKYYIGTIEGTINIHLTESEKEGGLVSRWIPIKEAIRVFSKHQEIKDFEEKRGLYQREYSALKTILNIK